MNAELSFTQWDWGIVEGAPYQIQGIDIWSVEWRPIEYSAVAAKDPHYRENRVLDLYEAQSLEGRFRFAAAEISPGMWVFAHSIGKSTTE